MFLFDVIINEFFRLGVMIFVCFREVSIFGEFEELLFF